MADSETNTTLSRLSRRDVLSALLTTAGSTTLGRAGAAREATELQADPALIAWKAWCLAHHTALAWCRKQQRLETLLARTIGFPSVTVRAPEFGQAVRIGSLEAFDDVAKATPSIRRMRAFVVAELGAHQARWDDADQELGYSAALRQEEIWSAEEKQLAKQLFATDAVSIAGIAAKIDALIVTGAPSNTCDEFPWPELRRMRSELVPMMTSRSDHAT